jgi:hypothetical protein
VKYSPFFVKNVTAWSRIARILTEGLIPSVNGRCRDPTREVHNKAKRLSGKTARVCLVFRAAILVQKARAAKLGRSQ